VTVTVQHLIRSDAAIEPSKGAPITGKSVPLVESADILLFSFQGASPVFENGRLDEDESHFSDFGVDVWTCKGWHIEDRSLILETSASLERE
jgi:hypothetical protein